MSNEINKEKIEIHYRKVSLNGLDTIFFSSRDNSLVELVPLSIIDLPTGSTAVKWYCFAKNEADSKNIQRKSDSLVLEYYQNHRNEILAALQQFSCSRTSWEVDYR